MDFSFGVSEVIAGLALILSLVATTATILFNRRHKSLVETQERLNQRLLAKEEGDVQSGRQADLSANLVKLGKGSHRLKVFNRGKATARDITISWPDDEKLLMRQDVEAKFPLELLEPGQGVDVMVMVYLGAKSKYQVTLSWSDDHSDDNEKTVYLTL